MSEHRYDKRITESCVDPKTLMVERQDPDNFPRLQTRVRCALEIAVYVFNTLNDHFWIFIKPCKHVYICKTNTLDKKVRARGQFH